MLNTYQQMSISIIKDVLSSGFYADLSPLTVSFSKQTNYIIFKYIGYLRAWFHGRAHVPEDSRRAVQLCFSLVLSSDLHWPRQGP